MGCLRIMQSTAGISGVFALRILAVWLAAWACAPFAFAQAGRAVDNIATLEYVEDGNRVRFSTNVARFIIEPTRTKSQITLLRYAPGAQGMVQTVARPDYSPSGGVPAMGASVSEADGYFVPLGPALSIGGVAIDLSGPVPLAPARTFLPGELMVIRVDDPGQNIRSGEIEKILVTVTGPSGDIIILRLHETGPDTGVFTGYLPTTTSPTPPNDASLTLVPGREAIATYTDAFDPSDVSTAAALVDPFGRVFDAVTGELISGARVTLLNADTGRPAEVFGADGVSVYPSSLVTGAPVTDASGTVYALEPGQFLFPLVRAGRYRISLEPPSGYSFASSLPASAFAALPNAPFEIAPASYGAIFDVRPGPPVSFDVPLDPAGDVALTKRAVQAAASVGDAVGYVIEVTNPNSAPVPVILADEFPRGFRLVPGSLRRDGEVLPEAGLSTDGSFMTVPAGAVTGGSTVRITYMLTVSAGARPGQAVNRARIINAGGSAISNSAEASVEVIEDLLRSRFTLIGRVIEDGCDGDGDRAGEARRGRGVAGVRIYLETGDYVVTDDDGLYHFEGVRPGTHVVRLDTATVPQGYSPMLCEDNTRFAGSMTSQFVDVQGGGLWRANFYLRRTGEISQPEETGDFDDMTEYLAFDQDWIETADPSARFVYPQAGRTPSSRSVNIGIVHPKGHSVVLTVNGAPPGAANVSGNLTARGGGAELARWRGVDIGPGENRIVATLLDSNGGEVAQLTETVWFVARAERARLVADQSVLVADGRTVPVIAVRLEDAAGRAVHRGRAVKVDVIDGRELRRSETFRSDAIAGLGGSDPLVTVGADGIALIRLEPTLKSGRVKAWITLDTGRREEIDVRLSPEKRDWILVGLIDGSLGLSDSTGAGDQPIADMKSGRAALFAKGVIKGDWLLTLAVDTAKRRGDTDAALFDGYIDPDAYYTLYGDKTWQGREAESRYPLFISLEREAVELIFGDFDAALDDTQLGRYARRLSGLKGELQERHFSAKAFAADTDQAFRRDERAADGTSGPYRLGSGSIVRNSEVITIETRERLRPDRVLGVRTLVRWIDYDIDYRVGELIFRHPVNVSDFNFNPNIIVATYETEGSGGRNVSFGGRAALYTQSRALEAGLTFVREDNGLDQGLTRGDLTGVDVTARLGENTELRAEAAHRSNESAINTGEANAYLVEMVHSTEAFTGTAYYREEEAGFGLGQQGPNTAATRRLGADVSLLLSADDDLVAARRRTQALDVAAYREANLSSASTRDVISGEIREETERSRVSTGVKYVREDYSSETEQRDSLLATIQADQTLPGRGLTLSLAHEQPLGSRDEATLFPERTIIGADQRLTEWATLSLRHEQTNGANASGNTTLAGLTLTPWTGGELRAVADEATQDSASRLSATFGADQTVRLTEAWTASLGAAHRARVDGGDEARDLTAGATTSPIADGIRNSDDPAAGFSSFYAGLGYRRERSAATIRFENRDSDLGERRALTVGAAREANDALSYGVALRAETDDSPDFPDSADRDRVEARLGAAWRPRGEELVVLARLDAKTLNEKDLLESQKWVGNLATNFMISQRSQAKVDFGLKHQETRIAGVMTSGWSHLTGAELRHDITRRVDLGFRFSALTDHQSRTTDFAFGPSIGVAPVDDVWISVGYNVAGLHDRDFDGAEYSREGVYLRLRVKLDETSAAGFLRAMSPS